MFVMMPIENNKGFILVITLLLMVSMSAIGLLALINASTETLIGRNEKEQKVASQLAEAGLNEAYARVHLVSGNSYYLAELSTDANYRTSSWQKSFNQSTSRENLCSGSAASCSYSVTIQYLLENTTDGFYKGTYNNEIVMFGQDYQFPSTMTPQPPTTGYLPVYKITSTGTYGNTTVQTISYIAASSLNTQTQGAIDSNSDPALDIRGGSSNITGGTTANAGYDLNDQIGIDVYDTAQNSTSMEEIADERHYCSDNTCGAAGDDIPSSGSIDGVVTDWGDFAGGTYSTIIFIDNDNDDDYNTASTAKPAKISGNLTGRGILIVTGDLTITGGLQYKGFVYVMGTLTISGGGGGLNVTGGIIAKNTVSINGDVTVTYDTSTLQGVGSENSQTSVIRWARQ